MKFRYKKYGEILRPVIPIKLRNRDISVGYEVLVDSGADLCIFHAGFLSTVAESFHYGVVGQRGFFEHFTVQFDYRKEEIELRPKKNS